MQSENHLGAVADAEDKNKRRAEIPVIDKTAFFGNKLLPEDAANRGDPLVF
jgi:hypothetical protein